MPYATFFAESEIFREAPLIYRQLLYFNLPYEEVVKPMLVPELVFSVSTDNEDESKKDIGDLLKEAKTDAEF
jgi:hypothetical protein